MSNITEEMRNTWIHQLDTICDAVADRKINLTDWEKSFFDDIYHWRMNESRLNLSFKQSSCLRRIYNKIS